MKICLINPPIEDFYITGVRRQPLGLLYIASALQNAGYDPILLNCHSRKKSILPLPDEFNYLKKYIHTDKNDITFPYKNYTHYGMSWQEINLRIKNINAEIYFISSLFTTYYEEVEKIINIIRENNKNSIIVAGGYHASLYPEYYLKEIGIDFVISGEGEHSSVLLTTAIDKGHSFTDIPGLSYIENKLIKKNNINSKMNIEDFKIPARELLLERDFKAYRKKIISMISSRGCPNRCSFCTGKIIWGYNYRKRNIESVIEEIDLSIKKFNINMVNFEDDNIFPSKKRGMEFLKKIISEKNKRNNYPEFTAMNGISIENIDDEIIILMKEAGFKELNISLVSHSNIIQKNENRPFDSEKFKYIAESGKKAGMNVRSYFILGLPEQDLKEVDDTINFLKKIDVKIFPSVYYNVYSEKKEWKMQRSSAFFNEGENLTREDLVKSFNRCFK